MLGLVLMLESAEEDSAIIILGMGWARTAFAGQVLSEVLNVLPSVAFGHAMWCASSSFATKYCRNRVTSRYAISSAGRIAIDAPAVPAVVKSGSAFL